MCIHSFDSSREAPAASADAGRAWSILASLPNGAQERFSAGVTRDEDGHLVVSLLNHTHDDVGVVQWVGEGVEDDEYGVSFAKRVVSEYEKPTTQLDRLLEALTGRPAFFQRADDAFPGFVSVDPSDARPTPDGFGG